MYISAYGGFHRHNGSVCSGSTVLRINNVDEFSNGNRYDADEYAILSCSSIKRKIMYNRTIKCDLSYEIDRTQYIISHGNKLYLLISNKDEGRLADFWFKFQSEQENVLKPVLNITLSTRELLKLYEITSVGFSKGLNFPTYYHPKYFINVGHNYVLMLSFKLVQFYSVSHCSDFMDIFTMDNNNKYNLKSYVCGVEKAETELYNTSLKLVFESRGSSQRPLSKGFRILYSFHHLSSSIVQLSPGMFNCSQFYPDFHGHLGCNVRSECIGGEDETSTCPYFNSQCKPDSVYLKVSLHTYIMYANQ